MSFVCDAMSGLSLGWYSSILSRAFWKRSDVMATPAYGGSAVRLLGAAALHGTDSVRLRSVTEVGPVTSFIVFRRVGGVCRDGGRRATGLDAGAAHDIRAAREHGIIAALPEAGLRCWGVPRRR